MLVPSRFRWRRTERDCHRSRHCGPGHCRWQGSCVDQRDRKSTRLNYSHSQISYAVFCLKPVEDWHGATEHYHDTHMVLAVSAALSSLSAAFVTSFLVRAATPTYRNAPSQISHTRITVLA